MISNDDTSRDGGPRYHNTGNKGPVFTVGSRSLPLYPLVILCLGLLNTILLLAAIVIGIYCGQVNDVSAPKQIGVEALIEEVKQLQLLHADALKSQAVTKQELQRELMSLQLLKIQLEQNKTLSDGLQKQLEAQHLEIATLQAQTADTQASCGQCQTGWLLLNKTCYFHSKSVSMDLKNWDDSRADCISRGADLAVIDTWEKQVNIYEFLPKVDSVRNWWTRPGTWIGLRDVEIEGNWVWLNNVTAQPRYWIEGEPNSWGPEGEDCAAVMNMRNAKASWYDARCKEKKEWLCEIQQN